MNTDPRNADDPATRPTVMALLRAAAPSAPADGALPGEAEALAAFRAAAHDHERPAMQTTRNRARVLIATSATAAALACMGSAAAATGSLPGAAQQTAHDVLARIGVTVPGPNAHSAEHADTRGRSASTPAQVPTQTPAQTPAQTPEAQPTAHPSAHGKGAEISQLARTTTATGVAKGAEISTLASGGKSQAGQHGSSTTPGSQGTAHKPTAPGSQGTAHKPAAPGSQGTAHKPAAGSAGSSHRP
jgi:hypothetical protein